jgi:hypothetical protein
MVERNRMFVRERIWTRHLIKSNRYITYRRLKPHSNMRPRLESIWFNCWSPKCGIVRDRHRSIQNNALTMFALSSPSRSQHTHTRYKRVIIVWVKEFKCTLLFSATECKLQPDYVFTASLAYQHTALMHKKCYFLLSILAYRCSVQAMKSVLRYWQTTKKTFQHAAISRHVVSKTLRECMS